MTLATYIDRCRNLPFQWGVFDCLTFADGAYHAHNHKHFAADWLGGYTTERGALRRYLQGKGEFASFVEALDERLERLETLHPPVGCVAFREADNPLGGMFGITLAHSVAGVGPDGLRFVPHGPNDFYWR